MNFRELGLAEKLCLVLEQSGITTPTPVQEKAIRPGLAGLDLIVSAQTGTGKTLAYSLPMVTRLEADSSSTALVLVPTRELATQVHQVLGPLLKTMGLSAPCVIIGGVAMGPQFAALRRGPRVIIATPGRLIDHIQNGKLRLDSVKTLVLDEADRMLDMGFLPQVRNVLKVVGANRQTMLFTATLPLDLKKMIQDLMKNPEQIFVDPPSSTKASIEQRMLEVNQDQKTNALLEAVGDNVESVLVFARTKRRTDRIAQFLTQYGVRNDRIHGDRSQAQRQKAIDSFKAGRIKVLVATDIAARGLDIPLVELVVNFDLPETKDDYVHRIGRTGRAGADGIALSFVANDEHGQWAEINGAVRKPGQPKAAHRTRPANGPQKKRHFAPWGKRPNKEVASTRA
ncbi:MAG: DEAD/DEAH box helicase [Bdellovibrionota bacterium]